MQKHVESDDPAPTEYCAWHEMMAPQTQTRFPTGVWCHLRSKNSTKIKRPCVRRGTTLFPQRRRAVAGDLGFEISEAVPVGGLVQVHLGDGHGAKVLRLGQHITVVVKDT